MKGSGGFSFRRGRGPGRATDRYSINLRVALLAVLLAGAAFAASRYPAMPAEEWPTPHAFEAGDAICDPLLAGRQWTTFEVPAAAGAVTSAEIDRKLAVPADLVCRANQAEPCADSRFAPGHRVVLPLDADAEALEAARAAAGPGTGPGSGPGATPNAPPNAGSATGSGD